MMKNRLFPVPLFTFLLMACGSSPANKPNSKAETILFTEPKQNAAPLESGSTAVMSDADVWNQELRVLIQETPKTLNMEWFYKDFGYSEWPKRIFARKGKPSAEDRINERIPVGKDDSAAHRFLMRVGQQIYQQALLAHKSGDTVYADNALLLIRKITGDQLSFISDPKNPKEHNDNRFLASAWFLSLLARGAHILDTQMNEEWKTKSNWAEGKNALNQWLGTDINQNWDMSEAPQQSPLNLAAQAGLMNWVGNQDSLYGATNRSFASLEALIRVAEFRGGRAGRTTLRLNAWNKDRLQHDGSIGDIFQMFRAYLKYYFHVPLNTDSRLFILKYNPGRSSVNQDPELLNKETCRDPAKLGYQADCLVNKDAYRNDTYHPLMGFASILHIIDSGMRWGYELTPEEHEKVIMGLRWAAMNNTPFVTSEIPTYGIAVWELAFRHYSADQLGPYCQRDLDADRAVDGRKRAALAWGYSRIAFGM